MKGILLLILTGLASSCFADPHYVQALHPYCFFCDKPDADKSFRKYTNKFKNTVNVDIKKHSSEDEGDMYIYIYIINTKGAEKFILDISCPGNETYPSFGMPGYDQPFPVADFENASSDPVLNNPAPSISTDGKMEWILEPDTENQAMWIYSPNAPTDRNYQLQQVSAKENPVQTPHNSITGVISAPSCN